MFFLTSALNLASTHVPVDQPLLFRFVTALLWLLAVSRDWPVSDFIHASCWPALLDLKTEKMSKKNWMHRFWGPSDTSTSILKHMGGPSPPD
jgi:hypothetical protein